MKVVLERDSERSLEQDDPLARALLRVEEKDALRVHRLGERLRLVERLGKRESAFEIRQRTLVVSREVKVTTELSCDRRYVLGGFRCL